MRSCLFLNVPAFWPIALAAGLTHLKLLNQRTHSPSKFCHKLLREVLFPQQRVLEHN